MRKLFLYSVILCKPHSVQWELNRASHYPNFQDFNHVTKE